MKKRVIIGIIIILFLAVATYAFIVYNKPARDISKEDGITIAAHIIFDSFSRNEAAANQAFLNKAIIVSGKVSGLKANQSGDTVVYLATSDPVFGINCTFAESPGKIAVGDSISFKGICTGYLSDVIINNGILVANYK